MLPLGSPGRLHARDRRLPGPRPRRRTRRPCAPGDRPPRSGAPPRGGAVPIAYTYDLAGRLTTTTDRLGAGHTTTDAYDALDRLIRVTAADPNPGNGTTTDVPDWSYGYDALGRLVGMLDRAGAATRSLWSR
jgi:YD repeat-containing protein